MGNNAPATMCPRLPGPFSTQRAPANSIYRSLIENNGEQFFDGLHFSFAMQGNPIWKRDNSEKELQNCSKLPHIHVR